MAVIAVVVYNKKMRTVTNIFICQLAFGDLMIVLFCMPFMIPQLFLIGASIILYISDITAISYMGDFVTW